MSEKEPRNMSNVYLVRDDEMCLGMKKRHHAKSFGVGKWNGFGGKIKEGETPEQAAIRECQEECGVTPLEMAKVAIIRFVDNDSGIDDIMNTFLCDNFEGEPHETEEMTPKWFKKDELPFDQMWDNDKDWMKKILDGKKFKATVYIEGAGELGDGKDETKGIEYEYVNEFIEKGEK